MIIRKMRHSSVGMLRFFFVRCFCYCFCINVWLRVRCTRAYSFVFVSSAIIFYSPAYLRIQSRAQNGRRVKKNIKMNKSIWASCCCCGNWRLLQLSHRWPNTPAGPDRKIHILWWSVCVCSWPNAKQQNEWGNKNYGTRVHRRWPQ